jgi:hypothetical protein
VLSVTRLTTEIHYSMVVAVSSLTGSQLVLSLKRSSNHNNGETLGTLRDEEFGL